MIIDFDTEIYRFQYCNWWPGYFYQLFFQYLDMFKESINQKATVQKATNGWVSTTCRVKNSKDSQSSWWSSFTCITWMTCPYFKTVNFCSRFRETSLCIQLSSLYLFNGSFYDRTSILDISLWIFASLSPEKIWLFLGDKTKIAFKIPQVWSLMSGPVWLCNKDQRPFHLLQLHVVFHWPLCRVPVSFWTTALLSLLLFWKTLSNHVLLK